MSAVETAHTNHRQLVVFELADEQYGLPIEHVQEIIRYSTPRHFSTDRPWIEGVINLRGKIVPVWNLAQRLGVLTQDDATAANIVIVETGDEKIGLIVNHVTEVLTLDEGQAERTPASSDLAVHQIAKLGDRLVFLLDPGALD